MARCYAVGRGRGLVAANDWLAGGDAGVDWSGGNVAEDGFAEADQRDSSDAAPGGWEAGRSGAPGSSGGGEETRLVVVGEDVREIGMVLHAETSFREGGDSDDRP